MPAPLSIGFLGGVPPALGGGGLEIQMRRTASALAALGHQVVRVEGADADVRLDVLHAFHAELQLAWLWPHWRINRVPLVLSPVLPVRPGREERALALAARLPLVPSSARTRRAVFARADAVVVLTEHERHLVGDVLRGDRARTHLVGNGVDPIDDRSLPAAPAELAGRPYVLLLGHVSARKRQAAVVEAAARAAPVVVAGDFTGTEGERRSWQAAVARAGAVWLGPVRDQAVVRRLLRDALALVLFSEAEAESLAVLEALAVGTPAVLSDIPAHRDLRARYPAWISLARDVDDVPTRIAALGHRQAPPPRPSVPTWAQVAARLVELYEGLLRARHDRPE